MSPVEDILRERLHAYTATVSTTGPNLEGAARAARTARRRRTGLMTTSAVVALALVVGGSLRVARHRGDGIAPAAAPRTNVHDVTSIPGFTELAGVTVPARVEPQDVAADGDEIWVSGQLLQPPGGTTSTGVLLHGRAGSTLVPVDSNSYFGTPVLRDGHAFVVRLGATAGSTLQERDAATGLLQHEVPLATYGADQAVIVPTGDGTGPLAVVLTTSVASTSTKPGVTNAKLRVGILGDDGTVSALTPVVRGGDFAIGDSIGGSLNPVISLEAGTPRYLFYGHTRLDLRTGRQETENPDPDRPVTDTGPAAVAELGGRIVYLSVEGVVYAGAPSSLMPAMVDAPTGRNPLDPTSDEPPHLTLVNGRLFLSPALPAATGTAVAQPVTELDPATLKPTATTGTIAGDALTNAQTLATYSPSGQVGNTGTGGVIRLFAPARG